MVKSVCPAWIFSGHNGSWTRANQSARHNRQRKIGHVRYLLMANLTNPLPGPDWFGHPRVVAWRPEFTSPYLLTYLLTHPSSASIPLSFPLSNCAEKRSLSLSPLSPLHPLHSCWRCWCLQIRKWRANPSSSSAAAPCEGPSASVSVLCLLRSWNTGLGLQHAFCPNECSSTFWWQSCQMKALFTCFVHFR